MGLRTEYVNYDSMVPINVSFLNVTNYPLHWHHCIEIIYVIKGQVEVTLNTENFILKQDEIGIINIDEAHSVKSDVDNKVLVFKIDPYFFEKYYGDIENMFFYTNTDGDGQNGEEYEQLKEHLSRILCEFVQRRDEFDEEIEERLINLLYYLVNNFNYLISEREELKDDEEQLGRYHRIAKYIFNNYNNNITLQDIADKEYLSTNYLSHEIKYATGYNFTDLINLTRVEESTKFLIDTDMSISDISDEIGFSHLRYYNKNFKAYYKMTPIQYRKKYKINVKGYEDSKKYITLNLEEALEDVLYYIEDYSRFNYSERIYKVDINLDSYIGEFTKDFKNVINIGESFELLLEDNKDILEDVQSEIGFEYVKLQYFFNQDLRVFNKSNFYNWNRVKDILEFIDSIYLKPLIVLDNKEFSSEKYKDVITSFLRYFEKTDTVNISDFKFQFSNVLNKDIIEDLKPIFESYNIEVLDELYDSNYVINNIYDTTYMVPYIIHNAINNPKYLEKLECFDILDNQKNLSNEVFIGYPGLINDEDIRKPAYYAYYLLNKLGNELVDKKDGYIVTKSKDEYQILLYSYTESLSDNVENTKIIRKKDAQNVDYKKYSINILNLPEDSRVVTYRISDSKGSAYNNWVDMGMPRRLRKDEKEILNQASYPEILFSSLKKNAIANIKTSLEGYGAILFSIKIVQKHH